MKRYYKLAIVTVALTLLVLSLRHLAHGIATVTGVSLELATLANIHMAWTRGLTVATCVLSAGFNVLGFLEHAHGLLGQSLAVALGIFVPAAVYGLTDTLNPRPTVKQYRAKAKAAVRRLKAA